MRARAWLPALLCLVHTGCGSGPADVLGANTSDGRAVRDMLGAGRRVPD